jgi:hypothetical protein
VNTTDSQDLLAEYRQNGSGAAFRELVAYNMVAVFAAARARYRCVHPDERRRSFLDAQNEPSQPRKDSSM